MQSKTDRLGHDVAFGLQIKVKDEKRRLDRRVANRALSYRTIDDVARVGLVATVLDEEGAEKKGFWGKNDFF